MPVRKVDPTQIPQDKLGDLQVLLPQQKKEYVVIGSSYYEVYPTSAVKLMEVISKLVDILDNVRKRKIQRIYESLTDKEKQEFKASSVVVDMRDLMADPEAVEQLKALLPALLEGVDPNDMEQMTIGQLFDAFEKITALNIDTLPPSYKQFLEEQRSSLGATANP